MPYDINAALERLEKNLQNLDSARNQVENTVKASAELQSVVSEYVSSVKTFCAGLQTWETNLRAKGESLSHEYEAAISRLNATCTEIVNSFENVVEQTSTGFNSKTSPVIEKFIEQNKNLAVHVDQLTSLHDSIKKATDELANIKNLLENLSKDLKDSQDEQDSVLGNIKQKVDEIFVAEKNYKDDIVSRIDSAQTKLDSLQNELSQMNTLCQGIKADVSELKLLMNTSTTTLSNAISLLKAETKKSVNINRWILIAGLIALAALHFLS